MDSDKKSLQPKTQTNNDSTNIDSNTKEDNQNKDKENPISTDESK
jgi:hypothetical protein